VAFRQTPYLAEVGRRRVHRSAGSGLALKLKWKFQRRRQVGRLAAAAARIIDVTSGSISALSVAGRLPSSRVREGNE
jgi:hypothetical protein